MNQKSINFLKMSINDYRFWIKLVLGLSQILSIFIFISNTYIRNTRSLTSAKTNVLLPGYYAIFVNLSFFTTLSNLFCGVFFFHSALSHNLEGKGKFNNDRVAKIAAIYISLTLIIYNISQWAEPHPYHFSQIIDYMSFIFEHSLGPLFVILYYIFLYDHKYTSDIKQTWKKDLRFMLFGLVGYGVFFWILGMLSKYGGGLGLYYWNGAQEFGKGSHFVYPFFDFSHKPYFFKTIPAAAESIIMISLMVLCAIAIGYLYSFLAILIRNKNWQQKLFKKLD